MTLVNEILYASFFFVKKPSKCTPSPRNTSILNKNVAWRYSTTLTLRPHELVKSLFSHPVLVSCINGILKMRPHKESMGLIVETLLGTPSNSTIWEYKVKVLMNFNQVVRWCTILLVFSDLCFCWSMRV